MYMFEHVIMWVIPFKMCIQIVYTKVLFTYTRMVGNAFTSGMLMFMIYAHPILCNYIHVHAIESINQNTYSTKYQCRYLHGEYAYVFYVLE